MLMTSPVMDQQDLDPTEEPGALEGVMHRGGGVQTAGSGGRGGHGVRMQPDRVGTLRPGTSTTGPRTGLVGSSFSQTPNPEMLEVSHGELLEAKEPGRRQEPCSNLDQSVGPSGNLRGQMNGAKQASSGRHPLRARVGQQTAEGEMAGGVGRNLEHEKDLDEEPQQVLT